MPKIEISKELFCELEKHRLAHGRALRINATHGDVITALLDFKKQQQNRKTRV